MCHLVSIRVALAVALSRGSQMLLFFVVALVLVVVVVVCKQNYLQVS